MVPKVQQDRIALTASELECSMNEILGSYSVNNCSTMTSPGNVSLVIKFSRLYDSYWLSIFTPSICLIVAAELTLFIDEAHFKAAITVSLTANLVMYTLYRGVQEKLPDDSSLKLIDIWLLHGLLMPMIVFIILTTNHLLESNKLEENHKLERNIKVGNSNVKVAFEDESKPPKTVGCYAKQLCL